jgi:hypothetical protein
MTKIFTLIEVQKIAEKSKQYALPRNGLESVFFLTDPTVRSPYALYGNPPMWKVLEFNNDVVMYARPIKDNNTDFSFQFKKGDKWIGQGIQMSFEDYEKNGLPHYVIRTLGSPDLKGTKPLTENQKNVIFTLTERGAGFTAEATKQAWQHGEAYYIDKRNDAGKGILRAFEKGNAEAKQSEISLTNESSAGLGR